MLPDVRIEPVTIRIPDGHASDQATAPGTVLFYYRVMVPKDADRNANSVDPDQEQYDLGLHCLPRPVCLKT